MPVTRIAVDGLWRCLCPSIDAIALSQSTRPLPRPSKPFARSKAQRAAYPRCLQARRFSTSIQANNEAEGPKIRFFVAKDDAQDAPDIKKGWVRHIPHTGELENDSTPGNAANGGLDVDVGYWKLKKARAEQSGYGLTESQMRKSGKYEDFELGEERREVFRRSPPQDIARSTMVSKQSQGGITNGRRSGFSGNLNHPRRENDVLVRRLRETVQLKPGQEMPGSRRSGLRKEESRTGATELGIADDQEQLSSPPEDLKPKSPNLKSVEARQAKLSSDSLNRSHEEEASKGKPKQQERRPRSPIRPLWVPHRDYGITVKPVETPSESNDLRPVKITSERSSSPRNERAAFFQAVREQRQQHGAQPPKARRQESSEPRTNTHQSQPQEARRETVAIWEQEIWDTDDVNALHDRLRSYRSQEGNYGRVVGLVEYLVKNRGEEPALIHYDSLIRANADAKNGSAESVRALLEEMRGEGIRGDSGLYHGALQALAIHPDYALRADIMQEMKERWFGLSPEGWHSLVVGLVRDRQVEMALDKLEQMHSDGILIQPWLYDIFTYTLCEFGELDEAYKLVHQRLENSRLGITLDHWHYLLDRFSNAYHYEATKEVWDAHVRNSELVPSDGTCVAVLNLAARNSDPALATSVIQILSARETPLSPFHYEALVAAYTGIEDIKTAFRVLAIMEKAGHDPAASSTRPLYLYLSTSDQLCHEAWRIVNRLHKDGHTIPITAVNVIIESLSKFGSYDAAFEYYKRLHEVCPRGPNTETINVTLQGLGRTRTGGKARAMFLASEIQALNIKPDILTYDRLILICLTDDDYEDAFRYLEEMEEVGRESVEHNQMGWWMRKGTAAMMVRRCALSGDERAWEIVDGMTERGMGVVKLKEWARANWRKGESGNERLGTVAKA